MVLRDSVEPLNILRHCVGAGAVPAPWQAKGVLLVPQYSIRKCF